jgi:polar amino acid transport system substrate-binding protein
MKMGEAQMTTRQQPDTLSHGPRRLRVGLVGLAALAALVVTGCGATTSTGPGGTGNSGATPTSTVTCPTNTSSFHLVASGKLSIASDTTYAPAEFKDASGNFVGYDMDLAREIARRLCLTPDLQTADFGAIIPNLTTPALGQGRYDMSISSFTINDDRQKKVDMVPYFTAGESLLVPKGNPKNFSKFEDMCGKIIAVQDNTVEQQELEDANGGHNNSGQAPVCASNQVKIVHNPDQSLVILDVVNGSADASYQDSPVTGYYVSQHKDKLQIGPITVAPSPEGIVMRKDNPALETAVKQALDNMRTDGTYLRILKQWGQDSSAYPPLP